MAACAGAGGAVRESMVTIDDAGAAGARGSAGGGGGGGGFLCGAV